MEKDQKALPLGEALKFASEHGLQNKIEEILNIRINETSNKKIRNIRKGYIVDLLDRNNLLNVFKDKHWPFGKTPEGEKKQRDYLTSKKVNDDSLSDEDDIEGNQEGDNTNQQFALESHLRDFLSKNLSIIEPGLKLYHKGDQNGVEYKIDNGRIDILAIDKDEKFVVIELKVSCGRNRTVGQLLYYMDCVNKKFGIGSCRGIIIAGDNLEDLGFAVRLVPHVSLFRYRLSVTIEPAS